MTTTYNTQTADERVKGALTDTQYRQYQNLTKPQQSKFQKALAKKDDDLPIEMFGRTYPSRSVIPKQYEKEYGEKPCEISVFKVKDVENRVHTRLVIPRTE